MDKNKPQELIKKGESETVEFKKSTAQMERALRTICGFLNHKGGRVYFGISDKNELLGRDVSDSTLKSLSQKIRHKIKPEVSPEIKVIEIKGKKIIEVKVKQGANKPYYLDGIAYKRVGSESPLIAPEELERIILAKNKMQWDSQICDEASLNDIDEEKVNWFLRKAKYERNFNVEPETKVEEILERLELIKNKNLTNAAVLLFGKRPQKFFLQAETRCARFKGTEPLEFIDMKIFGLNLIDQRDNAIEFVKEHIQLHAKITGTQRVETWEYPIEAVREAITNAVCHRDYETSGNVQIRIFDDRIEILGCGHLPEPLTPQDLRKKHRSIPRNPLIAKCFFLIKIIEEWGTGTNRMIEECLNYKLPEPIFEEITGSLVVSFKKYRILEKDLEKLNERQKRAINYLKTHKKITRSEYVKLTDCSERTAFRDIESLKIDKILIRKGEGKKTYYELA